MSQNVLRDTQLSTTASQPTVAKYLYFGLCLLWLIQGLVKVLSLMKGLLVPEWSLKQLLFLPLNEWNFPETTTRRVAHIFPWAICPPGPSGGEGGGSHPEGRVMAPASLHSGRVLQKQRLTVEKVGWICPSSSQLLRKQFFCCLVRGGTDSLSAR